MNASVNIPSILRKNAASIGSRYSTLTSHSVPGIGSDTVLVLPETASAPKL